MEFNNNYSNKWRSNKRITVKRQITQEGEMMDYLFDEYYNCPYCGERVCKHIYKEGARYHVLSYSNLGVHCSTKACIHNHKCSNDKRRMKK